MGLPVIDLEGSPYEQGERHGRELRERIAHNLAVYFERFLREGKLPREEVLARAQRYLDVMAGQNADYLEGMRGVAAGSGFSLPEIAALNVRYEIIYNQYTRKLMGDDCTAFAVGPGASANGHLLAGQNWDWFPQVLGAVLRTRHADGFRTLGFTEAGIFGPKIGLNDAGLGLAINGMLTTADDWSRLRKPFHVRCYEILRSRDFEAAVRVVTGTSRSCSTNFLIAAVPDRVVDLEAAPDRVREIGWRDGCLTHANHFEDPAALGIEEPPNDRRYLSRLRQERLYELLTAARPVSVEGAQECLRDHLRHPNSLCRHPDPALPPEEQSITVTAVVMDLHARELYLTDRQPCQSPFQEVALA